MPALVPTVVSDFHAVLSQRFAAPALFAMGLQVSFGRAGKVSIPAFIPSPEGAGFIGPPRLSGQATGNIRENLPRP